MSSSDYLYDFPMPSTSFARPQPTLAPRKMNPRRVALPRPMPDTPPAPVHFPSAYRSSSAKPASRAAQLSRLLDPSYSGSAPNAGTSAYVDKQGTLHDPDYRPFPTVVPQWERSARVSASLSHDDYDEDAELLNQEALQQRRWSQSRASYDTRPSRFGYDYATTYGYAHTYDISPPTSLDSTESSPFNDAEEKRPSRRLLKKRESAPAKEEGRWIDEERSRFRSTDEPEEYTPSQAQGQEWTPTCGQSIRREWQAISLRFRFGVFRAKRRVKRRIGF